MVRNSLVWKLTIWFLLLSLLPIGVIVLFVRQDVSEELTNLAKVDTSSQVALLAKEISSSIDERRVQEAVSAATDSTQVAFLVGEDGRYVAHGDESKLDGAISDHFTDEVARRVLSDSVGVVIEEGTGRLVGFSSVPTAFTKAVVAVDQSVVSAPMLRIERAALVQLAVSLLVIDVAIGVAIWIVFRPIRRLTSAAEAVGAGNLDVRIDGAEMEGELEVLTNAFNEMTRRVQGAYEDLEHMVAERTRELRESEERLRTVVTSAPVVLFAIDRTGVFTLSEGQGLEALGLSPGEVVGKSAFEMYSDVPRVVQDLHRALGGETFTSTVEVAELTFESYYSPVQNDSGDVIGLIGVSTDITERQQGEQTMRDIAVLEERNRVAREIHDTLAQGFTGIVLQLEAAEDALDGTHADVEAHLSRAKGLARESLQEARRSVWNLLPKSLEDKSLEEALEQEVASWAEGGGEKAVFELSGKRWELPSEIQTALLRICQESLTNVRRHAKATHVRVSLTLSAESARLMVEDDGQGFDLEDAPDQREDGGFGMAGMEQRARLLGGVLTVSTSKGGGCLVEVNIPLV